MFITVFMYSQSEKRKHVLLISSDIADYVAYGASKVPCNTRAHTRVLLQSHVPGRYRQIKTRFVYLCLSRRDFYLLRTLYRKQPTYHCICMNDKKHYPGAADLALIAVNGRNTDSCECSTWL